MSRIRDTALRLYELARATDYPPCLPLWERWADAFDSAAEGDEVPLWHRLEDLAVGLDEIATANGEAVPAVPTRDCGGGECVPGALWACRALREAGRPDVDWTTNPTPAEALAEWRGICKAIR